MRSKFCIFTGHKNEKHLILHHAINPFSASYTGLQVFFFKKLSLVTFRCKVFAIKEIWSQRKNICYIKRRTFHVGSPEFIYLISQPNIYGFFEVFFFNMLATFTKILVTKYLLICYGDQSDCNLERCYTSGALETKNNNNNNIKVLIVISLIQNTTVEEWKAGVLSMSLKLFNLV